MSSEKTALNVVLATLPFLSANLALPSNHPTKFNLLSFAAGAVGSATAGFAGFAVFACSQVKPSLTS